MKVLYKPLSVQLRILVNGVIVEKQHLNLPDWTKFLAINPDGKITAFCREPSRCNGWTSIGNQLMLKEAWIADIEKKIPSWSNYCFEIPEERIPGCDFSSIINIEL